MALRQILITRRLKEIETERAILNADIAAVSERRVKWQAREAAAVAALEEINDDTPAEERAAFENETKEIEAEDAAIRADEEKNTARTADMDAEEKKLRDELSEIETRAARSEKQTPAEPKTKEKTMRGDITMDRYNAEYRAKIADAWKDEGVRRWVDETCNLAIRGITNTSLAVPTVMLPILRERITNYSKLMPLVTVKAITGEGKQNIIGAAPEAVWTDTEGKFNELAFKLTQVKMAGEKVAGYIPVPNPYLQDSSEDLAALVVDMLGQAIGLAIDKAILYGTGTNMPVGIVPRLVAATSPTWWGASTAPAFTNLSATHVGKQSATSVTGNALLKEMLKILGTVKNVYNMGGEEKTWVMNPATWASIKVDTLASNAAGALVAGVNNTMPILGGNVVELTFMPENVIVGGYFGQYLLGERRGVEIRKSEHVKFLDDQTVFAGVARYDGRPIAGEAFAAFSLNSTAVSGTAVTFAEDTANAGD
mgnify:CR=1 FL=1